MIAYVLCKLEKRAETTDTLVILGSKNHTDLEEILLSIFDEIYEETNDLEWCLQVMWQYKIVGIPII